VRDYLTASRISCLQRCPRAHLYRYEIGIKTVNASDALRFGSAWHRAMEARANGATCEAALVAAMGDKTQVTVLQVATLLGLLAGYYRRYTDVITIKPEISFRYPLRRGRAAMWAAGVIDGVTETTIVEHKTAGCDIGPDSDYWLRLRGNAQILGYVEGARRMGHDPHHVNYDVVRKPSIAPREFVPTLDEAGLKIVKAQDGTRVIKRDGTPKQTADKEKGEALEGAPETPEQFGDRLAADCTERPDFYFARREVPILEDDLRRFREERDQLASEIGWRRRCHAWPRAVSERTCNGCEFAGFCLQGVEADAEHIPGGFVVGEKFEELNIAE